ncbi:hypothetical protein [Porphyrobacter sp. YT40]|uniref:hypothetical protein n=1 Tax=Porphyrobacter sp. YT40 TaxID=2547601 RepID=UPI001141BA04|nr:hypothetical protein [Porphyrobacter sp. YT40]QDH32967.1 hypothetical protein E2E27_00615 [Porphyrobacter sp. YT40]
MGELLDLFNAYRVAAQHIAALLLAAAIWRWGGGPERLLIGIFVGTMVLPVYPFMWLDVAMIDPDLLFQVWFVIDMIAAGLFIVVALNANRNYPLWIAGFQVVALVAFVVQALVDAVSPLAAAILTIGPSYAILVVLAAGFVRHRLRQRRFGAYREWRLGPPGQRWLRN